MSKTGEYAIVSAVDGTVTTLSATDDEHARPAPIGWTGDRVVWLTGGVGQQRLVTTDRQGPGWREFCGRDWTSGSQRLVENVSWSRDLSGG